MNKLILIISILSISVALNAQRKEFKTDFMQGFVDQEQRVGSWRYFDKPGELALIIDYDSSKIKYIKKDTSKYLIKTNGNWSEGNIETPPHYIGSHQEVRDHMLMNLRFPKEARTKKIQGVVAIAFAIDTTGLAGSVEIIKEISGGYTEEVVRVFSEIPNAWIQATQKSGPVESKMILVISFGFGAEYKPSQKEVNAYPLLFQSKPYILKINLIAHGK